MTYLNLSLSCFESKNLIWEKKPALCPVTGPFWRAGADTDAGSAGLILFISCCATVSCKGGISFTTYIYHSKFCWFSLISFVQEKTAKCVLFVTPRDRNSSQKSFSRLPRFDTKLSAFGLRPITHNKHTRCVDSSTLVFSLSSHRHSYIGLVFSSHFID